MIGKVLRGKPRLQSGTAVGDAFLSICILAASSLIGFIFHALRLSEANIISIYILGILLISSLTSRWVFGTVSSVCGVLLFNFLYAEPSFNFAVYDVQYSITMGVMLVASLITNSIMTVFRGQIDGEKLEIHRLDILLETSHRLQQAQNADDIYSVALTQLCQMFGQTVCIFPLSEGKLLPPMVKRAANTPDVLSGTDTVNVAALERFAGSGVAVKKVLAQVTAGKNAVCFKLRSAKTVFAVTCIIVDSDTRIVGFERNMILAMLDEIAQSLEKLNLHLFNERIAREAEAERLRTNLLRTISHDLRTPLTSISGNADILLSKGAQIRPDLRKQLYQTIYSDSEWLMNLVENLLFVTRIENGAMAINTEHEVLQETIQESLRCMARRVKEHTVSLDMADELLVVKMDVRLIMQVLINLVDNAVNYAPPGSEIRIRVYRRGLQAVVEVADTGCGIRDDDKEKVFEMFYTTNKRSSDSRRGIGLGLPLSQSIVRAHGGTITIADNDPSGVVVSFALNLEEVCLESKHSGC